MNTSFVNNGYSCYRKYLFRIVLWTKLNCTIQRYTTIPMDIANGILNSSIINYYSECWNTSDAHKKWQKTTQQHILKRSKNLQLNHCFSMSITNRCDFYLIILECCFVIVTCHEYCIKIQENFLVKIISMHSNKKCEEKEEEKKNSISRSIISQNGKLLLLFCTKCDDDTT